MVAIRKNIYQEKTSIRLSRLF